VVADEVRNLAHRIHQLATQMQQMIEELQVGERLGSVTQRIGEIDGMNLSVAAATEEQTTVIESLNVDINEINLLN